MLNKITLQQKAPDIIKGRIEVPSQGSLRCYSGLIGILAYIFNIAIKATFIDPTTQKPTVRYVNKNSFLKRTHADNNIVLNKALEKTYLHYREKIAKKGNAETKFKLTLDLLEPSPWISSSRYPLEKALALAEKAAAEGFPPAQLYLGATYKGDRSKSFFQQVLANSIATHDQKNQARHELERIGLI